MASGNYYDEPCYYSKYVQQSITPFSYKTNPDGVAHKDIYSHKEYQPICKTVGIHNTFRLPANTDLCQVAPSIKNNWGHLNSSVYRNPEYDSEKSRFTKPIDGYREMSIGINRIFQYNTKPYNRPYVFIPKNTQLEQKDNHELPDAPASLNNVNPNNVLYHGPTSRFVRKCKKHDIYKKNEKNNV